MKPVTRQMEEFRAEIIKTQKRLTTLTEQVSEQASKINTILEKVNSLVSVRSQKPTDQGSGTS